MLNWNLQLGNCRREKEPRFVMLNTGELPRPFIVLDLKSGHTFLRTANQSIAESFAHDYNAAEESRLVRFWRWLNGRVNPPRPEQIACLPDDGGQEWKARLERLQEMARERRLNAFNVEGPTRHRRKF